MNNINEEKIDKGSGFITIKGPSFINGIPDREERNSFVENIRDSKGVEFANLWFEKARLADGIPLRKDFGFEYIVKYGKNVFIAKREENDRWIVTYCGTDIVNKAGFEPTGKYMDEYADPQDT